MMMMIKIINSAPVLTWPSPDMAGKAAAATASRPNLIDVQRINQWGSLPVNAQARHCQTAA